MLDLTVYMWTYASLASAALLGIEREQRAQVLRFEVDDIIMPGPSLSK